MGVNVGVFWVGIFFSPCSWKVGRYFQLFLCPWSLWDSKVVFLNTAKAGIKAARPDWRSLHTQLGSTARFGMLLMLVDR